MQMEIRKSNDVNMIWIWYIYICVWYEDDMASNITFNRLEKCAWNPVYILLFHTKSHGFSMFFLWPLPATAPPTPLRSKGTKEERKTSEKMRPPGLLKHQPPRAARWRCGVWKSFVVHFRSVGKTLWLFTWGSWTFKSNTAKNIKHMFEHWSHCFFSLMCGFWIAIHRTLQRPRGFHMMLLLKLQAIYVFWMFWVFLVTSAVQNLGESEAVHFWGLLRGLNLHKGW